VDATNDISVKGGRMKSRTLSENKQRSEDQILPIDSIEGKAADSVAFLSLEWHIIISGNTIS
jgi:hypothetical protein